MALLFTVLIMLGSVRMAGGMFTFDRSIGAAEIAIVQFDSRPIADGYWGVAARWNSKYCKHHGHQYLYYSAKQKCQHDSGTILADPWCKVLTMLQAIRDHPSVHAFIYIDSDGVIDDTFFEVSLNTILEDVHKKLDWDVYKKPIAFNQDGPSWWCNLVDRVGYKKCLNAGTVVWIRNEISTKVLEAWWAAAMDSYEGNPLKRKFRTDWPWEQDRQMSIYHSQSDRIQLTSQPDNAYMMRQPQSKLISGGWCLSHLPRSGCYISHFCADKNSKLALQRKYGEKIADAPDIHVQYLTFVAKIS